MLSEFNANHVRNGLGYLVMTLILFVVAALFWRTVSAPYGYYFALFAALVTVAIYLPFESDAAVSLRPVRLLQLGLPWFPSLFALLFLALINLGVSPVVLTPFAIITTCFLPGYILLKLIAPHGMGRLEEVVLSFALSIPISSVLFLALLHIGNPSADLLVLGLFVTTLAPFLVARLRKMEFAEESSGPSLLISEILGLALCAGLFIFAILYRFPNVAPPSFDTVRLFSGAQGLLSGLPAQNPFEGFFYLQWAEIIFLAGPSEVVFQAMVGTLAFVVIIAFYMMAKKYFGEDDSGHAIIATLVWTTFGGLGWILYFQNPFSGNSGTQALSSLSSAFTSSYWDTGYGGGSWLWLWYRPITLGFTILFVLLFLLRNYSLGKKSFLLISSLAVFGLHFGHYPEFVVFAGFVLIASLLLRSDTLRLKDMVSAVFIGTLASLLLIPVVQVGHFSTLYLLLDAGVIAVSLLMMLWNRYEVHLPLHLPALSESKLRVLIMTVLIVYFSSVAVSSIIHLGGYSSDYQNVPLEYYPVLLGIAGVLAILSLPEILRKRSTNDLVLFVLLLFFALIIGRFMTFTGLFVVATDYFERRFIPIALACAAILAPVALSYVRASFPNRRILVLGVLFILVLGGTSSTFLAVETQSLISQNSQLSPADQQAIDLLRSVNPDSTMMTITPGSSQLSEYVPSNLSLGYYEEPLLAAQSPETTLNVLGKAPLSVLLTKGDVNYLKSYYPSSFLTSLVFSEINKTSQSYPEVTSLPRMSSPMSSSPIVLVLANESSPVSSYASELLSSGDINYTTALEDDLATISNASTVIAPTESIANYVLHLSEEMNLRMTNLIVLNGNGYGSLGTNFFSSPIWSASVQGGTILQSDGQQVQTMYGINSSTFSITPEQSSSSGLAMMYQGTNSQWMPQGLGNGSIGVPSVTENYSNASLSLSVSSGNYSQWQLSKNLVQPLNVSSYDFISFSWLGHNDGKQYIVEFDGSGTYYWYSFSDSWKGWRQVLLPMNLADGHYVLNGVSFTKVTKGPPTWSMISSIHIRLSATNANSSGDVGIAGLAFLRSETVRLYLRAVGSLDRQISLPSENSITLTSSGVLVTPDYSFSNGISSKAYYGNEPAISYSSFRYANSTDYAQISLKIPPLQSNSAADAVELHISVPFQTANSSGLSSNDGYTPLPTSVRIIPLESNYTVLSSYDNGVPLLVERALDVGDSAIRAYYVNAYPIIGKDSLTSLLPVYHLISKILADSIPSFDSTYSTPLAFNGNGLSFESMSMSGSVRVSTTGGYIMPLGGITISESGIDLQGDFSAVKTVIPVNFTSLEINGSYATVSGGEGYYSNIIFNNATVLLHGNETRLEINFANGTSTTITGSEIAIYGAQINSLLREPNVRSDGAASVQNLVAYHSIRSKFYPQNSQGEVHGTLTFQVQFGDNITVARNVILAGSYTSQSQQQAIKTESFVFSSEYIIPFLMVAISLASVLFLLPIANKVAREYY